MKRWEYLMLETSTILLPVTLANTYGKSGWELVAVLQAAPNMDRLWFKRRVTTSAPPEKP